MAGSLMALFPQIGHILGKTPDALYAYQRAFVRAGILESKSGRGPGSGVRASPKTISQLLIGLITHASILENIRVAHSIAKAVPASTTRKCPLTGATNFEDALSQMLSDEKSAARVNEIRVGVTLAQAFIRYDGSPPSPDVLPGSSAFRKAESSVFVGKAAKTAALYFESRIPTDTLCKLAKVVTTIRSETPQ